MPPELPEDDTATVNSHHVVLHTPNWGQALFHPESAGHGVFCISCLHCHGEHIFLLPSPALTPAEQPAHNHCASLVLLDVQATYPACSMGQARPF